MIPIWSGLSGHSERYDAWLCDIWGVLHNGAAAFAGVVEACSRYRSAGGRILLVSNAPRPAAAVASQLAHLGIHAGCYDGILTSGDVTRTLLRERSPGRVMHIGPERDLGIFEGLDVQRLDEAGAEAIVCSGLFDDNTETAQSYRALLERLQVRGLDMICANPDISVERGGRIVFCAGAVARLYEQLGGRVVYAGKPHAAVYRTALEQLGALAGRPIDTTRVLAIGDGVFTDIKGAAGAGIDALYVASAIHMSEALTAASAARLFAGQDFAPIAATPRLAW